jgi:hypothetical protein
VVNACHLLSASPANVPRLLQDRRMGPLVKLMFILTIERFKNDVVSRAQPGGLREIQRGVSRPVKGEVQTNPHGVGELFQTSRTPSGVRSSPVRKPGVVRPASFFPARRAGPRRACSPKGRGPAERDCRPGRLAAAQIANRCYSACASLTPGDWHRPVTEHGPARSQMTCSNPVALDSGLLLLVRTSLPSPPSSNALPVGPNVGVPPLLFSWNVAWSSPWSPRTATS